jgi:hypothetical protein
MAWPSEALEAALVSSLSSLDSNRLGYEVGVRINIDVLNAENQVYVTRRDLAKRAFRHPAFASSSSRRRSARSPKLTWNVSTSFSKRHEPLNQRMLRASHRDAPD